MSTTIDAHENKRIANIDHTRQTRLTLNLKGKDVVQHQLARREVSNLILRDRCSHRMQIRDFSTAISEGPELQSHPSWRPNCHSRHKRTILQSAAASKSLIKRAGSLVKLTSTAGRRRPSSSFDQGRRSRERSKFYQIRSL